MIGRFLVQCRITKIKLTVMTKEEKGKYLTELPRAQKLKQ